MKFAICLVALTAGVLAGCQAAPQFARNQAGMEMPLAVTRRVAAEPGNRQRPGARNSIREKIKRLTGESQSDVRLVSYSDDEQPSGRSLRSDPELVPTTDVSSADGPFLSLQQLDEMTLANNPTLAAAQAKIDAAHGSWVQAGLGPNPRFGYSAEEMGDEGTLGKQGGFLGQRYVRGGKLELSQAVAAQKIAKAEQELAAQRLRVLTDVRLAYYDFLIAVRRLDLTGTLLAQAKGISGDTQRLLDGGEAKRSDVLRAQIEERSIQIEVQNARRQMQTAGKNLSAVVGSSDELAIPKVDAALQAFAKQQLDQAIERGIDRQRDLDRVLESSPEIAAAAAQTEAARWSVQRAYAQAVPDIDARLAVHGDNATGHMVVGLEIEFPLPICNLNQGAIQQAHAQVLAAEQSADAVALNLRRRFDVTFQRYLNAKYQIDQYTKTGETDEEKGILEKARESITLNRRLHLAGEIKNLEMVAAQKVYTEANLSYLDAVRQLWAAILEIDGLLLKDSFR